MPKKRYTPEEIVAKLRQVDVLVSQGQNIADAIRQIGVSEVTYYRWRQEYGGLKADHVYWYRFTDNDGGGSRLGRTLTAPRTNDPQTVRFAFVSCQSVNEGAQNAFRRMIWEDQRAPAERRLGFVLHLGDFI